MDSPYSGGGENGIMGEVGMARGTRKRLEAVCQLAITHHKGLTVADTCFGRATDIHSASEDALRGATLRATDGTGTVFTNPCDTRRLMSEPKFKKCFTRPWLVSMWNKQRRALNVTRFSQPRTFLGRFLLLKMEIGCNRERSITSGWQWYRAEARSHSLMIWPLMRTSPPASPARGPRAVPSPAC